MNDDAAIALVRRWWDEVWRDGNVDAVADLVTDPFTRHTSAGTEVTTPAEYGKKLTQFQRALYRPETTVHDLAVEGDRVWQRATSHGVNLDTGDRAVVTWMLEIRVADGRIAEMWIGALSGVDWQE